MAKLRFMPHTEQVMQMFTNADEQQRTMIGEMHLHYEGEIRHAKETGEPQNIAYTVNALVDQSVEQMLTTPNGRKVRCAKGCGACCRIHVSVSYEEAYLLVGWCRSQGIEIDWQRLEHQAKHNIKTWNTQTPKDRRCAFLGDGDVCKVYEHRPSACRKYMVISDPRNCDTVKRPGHEVKVLLATQGEIIVSAMLGVLDAGPMARMLLKVRDEVEVPPLESPP